MRWFTSIIFSAVVLMSNLALAQSQPPAGAVLMNSVYVGADGKFESAPDTALLQFNIAAQQSTAREAYDKAAAATEQVRQALKNNGIDPKTAEFGFFAVQPVYDWKDPKHRVIGYQVVSNVTLKLHDFSKIGALIQQMSEIDSTQNQSLRYTLENIEAAKIKATEDAMRKAQNEARAVASAGGRTLGELLYASVDVDQAVVPVQMAPMARAAVAGAAPAPPTEDFTPQSVTINAHVNAMFGLK
ncbi:MAG TPA: SIMPL domain-containing protein [Candidatus Angelobacter sp.]